MYLRKNEVKGQRDLPLFIFMDYLSRVKDFIKKHDMIGSGDVIAAGVSGGADSVCLLLMLRELQEDMGFRLIAVNVEHGIRGDESIADSEFTEALCRDLGVSFYRYDVDVPALAKKRKISLEEAARIARYDAFDTACRTGKAEKIAVAHNADDNAETIIHNMVRGTSISGLTGIRPVRDNIIRPLLCLTRSEVEEYLASKNQRFKTDSTNLSDEYTRNRIRHYIIPEMRNINPLAVEHIFSMTEDISDALDILRDQISRETDKLAKEIGSEWRIDIQGLEGLQDYLKKEVIKKVMAEAAGGAKDIGRVHVNDCLSLTEKETGSRIDLAMGMEALREYGSLIIRKAEKAEETKTDLSVSVRIPGETNAEGIRLLASFPDKNTVELTKKTYTKFIDCDKIKGGLFLRHRKTGDRIVINEAGGRMLLKDYFINEKVPARVRDEIWLLCDETQVLWVIGYRLSEAFKVREDTSRVLRLDITESADGRED